VPEAAEICGTAEPALSTIAALDCYGNRPDQRNRTAGKRLSEKIAPQALVQALTAFRA
jgi:hypothetical protein